MSIPKAALVTGAAKRIGRAVAVDLARNGWAVAIHYHRSGDAAQAAVAEIQRAGGNAVALQADLSRESETETLVQRATDALGPVGCLVNNASVFKPDEIDTADRASWDAHLETNLRAPFVLIQAMARLLPAAHEGAVVNMLDQRVWNLTPHFLSYTLSKSGLWTLTQTLALALAPRIRVNAIGPGPTLPNERQDAEQFRRQYESIPLKKQVDVAEVCDAVRFLISATSMTGQMIALDGGQHLAWTHPFKSGEASE